MTRYLSGLCVAGLGLCGGGWLILAALAFGGEGGIAGRVNLATGAALVLVGCITAAAWSAAWRRRLRMTGVLAVPFPPVSRREARRNRRQLARDVRRAARDAARDGGGTDEGDPAEAAPRIRLAVPASGHDGASAADVLGELRALLGPLLTTAPANQVPADQVPAPLPWPPSLPVWQWPADVPPSAQWRPPQRPPEWPSPPAGEPAGDDELRRIGDGEEAWW